MDKNSMINIVNNSQRLYFTWVDCVTIGLLSHFLFKLGFVCYLLIFIYCIDKNFFNEFHREPKLYAALVKHVYKRVMLLVFPVEN